MVSVGAIFFIMKTRKEQFEKLPAKIRAKAVRYTAIKRGVLERSLKQALVEVCGGFSVLGGAFIFKETEEGHDYWFEISEKYFENE